jgi:hypothetical protein
MPPLPRPSKREAIVEALMRSRGRRPWSEIEINDIAREAAHVSLAEFRDLFPSRARCSGALAHDRPQVLEGTTDDLAGRAGPGAGVRRDDAPLRRAGRPTRRPCGASFGRCNTIPLSLAALNQVGLNSMRFMLAAAGISTEGPLGGLKLQGAVLVFANTMETWLEDDDPTLPAPWPGSTGSCAAASASWSAPRICAASRPRCAPWGGLLDAGRRRPRPAGGERLRRRRRERSRSRDLID